MNTWLLVPVKPLDEAKSRLAHVLSPEARARLMQELLCRTLQTAHATDRFVEILVISRDHQVRDIARRLDAAATSEVGDGLNRALAQAHAQATAGRAASTLILPADLPLLTVDDIYALLALGEAGADVVLSPSRDGGTNAMYLHDGVSVHFEFGTNSFQQHMQQAVAQSYRLSIYQSPSILFDVDRPADLETLLPHPAFAAALSPQVFRVTATHSTSAE